jgi:hypothetical protein
MRLKLLLLYIIFASCLIAPVALATTYTWDLIQSSSYTLSDPSAIEIINGTAQLIPIDQTDDDKSATGFGGGTLSGLSWSASALTLGTENIWSLPDEASSTDWMDMTGSSLVLHLDDANGSVTATDTSGSAQHLTCSGSNCPTFGTSGRLGTAATFDGSDDRLMINPLSTIPGTALTVLFWIRSSDTTKNGTPFSYANTNSDNALLIYDHQNLQISRGSSTTGATGISVADGTWHHIAITWRSSDGAIILYKDGVSVFTGTIASGSPLIAGGSLVLGQEQDSVGGGFGTSQALLGDLDEVAMLSGVLTASQIAEIVRRQAPARTGLLTSRIIDAGGAVSWNTLAWAPAWPMQKALPENQSTETAYTSGNVAMHGNQLLLHLDDLSVTQTDASGNGHAGTYTGALYGQPGRFGSSVGFDGVDDTIVIAHDTTLMPTSAMTMGLWVYPTKFHAGHAALLTKGYNDSMSYRLKLRGKASGTGECSNSFTDADMRADMMIGSTRRVLCWGNLNSYLHSWHHMMATYDGTTFRLYWDGTERASFATSGSIGSTTAGVQLSAPQYGGGEYFQGRLDEVSLFDRALTTTEVLDHFRRGATRLELQLRSCATADCNGVGWMGADGSAATYFDELTTPALGLPSLSLTSIAANRYLQYRAYLYSDRTADASLLSSVALGPPHYPNSLPTLINKVAPSYTTITNVTQTAGSGHQGTLRYQLSPNGADWYYHNGAGWSSATSTSQANTAVELNLRLASFATDVGTGDLFYQAIFDAEGGSKQVALDALATTYDGHTIPVIGFATSSSAVQETTASIVIPITFDVPPTQTITLPFTVTGSATTGSDYLITGSPLTIAAGATSAEITVMMLDDTVVESDEWLMIILQPPTNAQLGTALFHQVSIGEDDVAAPAASESGISETTTSEPATDETGTTPSTATDDTESAPTVLTEEETPAETADASPVQFGFGGGCTLSGGHSSRFRDPLPQLRGNFVSPPPAVGPPLPSG